MLNIINICLDAVQLFLIVSSIKKRITLHYFTANWWWCAVNLSIFALSSLSSRVVAASVPQRQRQSRTPPMRVHPVRCLFLHYVFTSTSQISARNAGNFLFFSFSEKHISEFWFPRVLISVNTDTSFANMTCARGFLRLSTYAFKASRYISWIFSTFQPSINDGRSGITMKY